MRKYKIIKIGLLCFTAFCLVVTSCSGETLDEQENNPVETPGGDDGEDDELSRVLMAQDATLPEEQAELYIR